MIIVEDEHKPGTIAHRAKLRGTFATESLVLEHRSLLEQLKRFQDEYDTTELEDDLPRIAALICSTEDELERVQLEMDAIAQGDGPSIKIT
jgi:hypothetical protein